MIHIIKYDSGKKLIYRDRLAPELMTLGPGDLLWLDLEDPTPEEAEVLKTHFKFHPLTIEDTLIDVQYPKLDFYPDYVFIVLHGINYLASTREFTTAEIDVFLSAQFLVTHHDHRMRSVRSVRERILQDPQTMDQGLDFVLHSLLDRMVDNYFPELEKMEDRIEELEGEIFGTPGRESLLRIFDLKREILHLKRIVYPQREVFHRLSRDEIVFIRPSTRLYFRDIYDSLFRMTDTADSYRDLLSGLLDAYLSSVSNSLNEVMKVLTMISTIFIPLSFVAGVYGMNFNNMPELEWKYGYYLVIGIMSAVAFIMIWFFRRKQWL